jgi:tRNA(Ile)-lysidine synthase
VRHLLLPRLRGADPEVESALLALAARAAALGARLDALFGARLARPADAREPVPCAFLTSLPEPLRPPALRWLLESAGVERLPSVPATSAFLSELSTGRTAVLDWAAGRTRLLARRGRLEWSEREPAESRPAPFSYTFSLPGEVELTALGLRLRVRRAAFEPWMLAGDPRRAGFAAAADRATVRSRKPGERMRPLGAPGSRKLKAILIDRGVPAEERDRLPLLEIEGELAWVPGVALGERFALRGAGDCWLAELLPLPGAPGAESGAGRRPKG